MSETAKPSRRCLGCDADISGTHFNRKRCKVCAEKSAKAQTAVFVKKWKVENPEKVRAGHQSWAKRFPLKKRLTHAKDIALSRGHVFELTREQLLEYWKLPCHYCGESILAETGIGLDRVDNSRGYTTDNVLPCCGGCNVVRSDVLTVEEMEAAMAAVLRLRQQKMETTSGS
jgi:hypothetical protein